MKRAFIVFVSLIFTNISWSQFSIQSPLIGHEGIHYKDDRIKNWAKDCHVERGLKHIENPSLGYATVGKPESIIGPPTVNVLSLGDGGSATVTFERPIKNGPGPDFAIYENGFTDLDYDTIAFLELAFVEVSSNGEDFFRFPSISLMQTEEQIDNFTFADARHYHNLAGKHIAGYGTPFDLDDLPNNPKLNKNAITHVKVIDVVGSIDPSIGSKDSQGNMINDPYPSPFPSSGFDLSAVAVLHEGEIQDMDELEENLAFYPNPSKGIISIPQALQNEIIQVYDINGRQMWEGRAPQANEWNFPISKFGMYFIKWQDKTFKLMIRE